MDVDGNMMCSEFTKCMKEINSFENITKPDVMKMWNTIQSHKYRELATYYQKVMKGALYLKFMENEKIEWTKMNVELYNNSNNTMIQTIHTHENQENFLETVLNLSNSPSNIQDLSEWIFFALFHHVISLNHQDTSISYYLDKIKEVDEQTGRTIQYSGINAKSLTFILESTLQDLKNEWNLKVFWKKFKEEMCSDFDSQDIDPSPVEEDVVSIVIFLYFKRIMNTFCWNEWSIIHICTWINDSVTDQSK